MAAMHTCPHCDTGQGIDANVPVERQTCIHCGKPLVDTAVSERALPRPARRVEGDDESEAPYLKLERVSVPGMVIAAGMIWILVGCLSIVSACYQLTVAGGKPQGAPGAISGANAGCCGLIIGAIFIHVGSQSIRGTAKDVLGNGIGSILFGVLYTGVAVVLFLTSQEILLFVGVMAILLAFSLYSAGVLALVSRSEYKAFRRATQSSRSRQ